MGFCLSGVLSDGVLSEWGYVQWGFVRLPISMSSICAHLLNLKWYMEVECLNQRCVSVKLRAAFSDATEFDPGPESLIYDEPDFGWHRKEQDSIRISIASFSNSDVCMYDISIYIRFLGFEQLETR